MNNLVIIWSNGDKQKVKVSEENGKLIMLRYKENKTFDWTILTENGGINMNYAREFFIENED